MGASVTVRIAIQPHGPAIAIRLANQAVSQVTPSADMETARNRSFAKCLRESGHCISARGYNKP